MSAVRGFGSLGAIALVVLAARVSAAGEVASDPAARIDAVSEGLGGDYVRLGKIRTGGLSEGQTARVRQVLRKGACYRFVAAGGEAVVDLDLKVFALDALVAKDQGEVATPVAELCAKRDEEVEVRLQLFGGKGAWALGLFAAGEAAAKVGSEEEAAALELADEAERIAPGMERIGEVLTGSLAHRSSTTLEVQLDRARCYKMLAVGGQGVQDMTMSVLDGQEEVASDRISGRRPIAQWCSPGRAIVHVKLTMYGGEGAFAFAVFGAKASVGTAPEKVGGSESDFVANRLRQLHAQHGKGRAAISRVFRGNLSTNNEQVFEVKLTAGHCYTLIGAGSPSVKDLDIALLGRNGEELQKDRTRDGYPVMDTDPCPTFTGVHTVRVRMANGFGQFGVQVFSD